MNNQQNTIIDDHRNMLMVSKKISEWQEKQLKTWPMVVFNNLDTVKVKYDFDNGEEFNQGSVEYIFDFKGSPPTGTEKEKGLESLTNWIRSIFWVNTKVKFKIGNKIWK